MTEAALYLAAINLVTFAVFAADKRKAVRGEWRVRENTLLLLAAIGGSAGAMLAQQLLRHKTRKEPFRTVLYAIVVVQAAGLVALIILR